MNLKDALTVKYSSRGAAARKLTELAERMNRERSAVITYTVNGKTYDLVDKTRFVNYGNGAFSVKAIGYDDVPLSTFENEQDIYFKHGRKALERYLRLGERPPKKPKSEKQLLKLRVQSAYDYLRQEGAI